MFQLSYSRFTTNILKDMSLLRINYPIILYKNMVSDITMANVTGTAVTRSVPEPKTIEGPLEDVGLDVVVTTT